MGQKSSGAAAYDAMIDAIRRGDFLPGARLREEEVGARLNLSRTPVREALRRLEAEGIVEHRPRAGAVVRQLSHAEVVELYEMRLVLERTAAEMAAQCVRAPAASRKVRQLPNGTIVAPSPPRGGDVRRCLPPPAV